MAGWLASIVPNHTPPGSDLAADSLLPERTPLTTTEEAAFRQWATESGIADVDHPQSYYDYRGLYRARQGRPIPLGAARHFPDTFKQHGHPTFSQESQYSRGRWDGGQWIGNVLVPPPSR
jgi:hypothetical protein